MNIWVVNPFDQLPNETDVPLRYWSLCKKIVEAGHSVTWWSSNFSHLRKTFRDPCPSKDGFSIEQISTCSYQTNIGFTRLKNHRQFAKGFLTLAAKRITSGDLPPPDKIVVSLPPLGVAEAAFKIRDRYGKTNQCQVILDIMDAWPQNFYRAFPQQLRKLIAPILLAPMHRSAQLAYKGCDKLSAVGQSYIDLATPYLRTDIPPHLCYHGTDLDRFAIRQQTNKPQLRSKLKKAVYLGAMGSGYDLMTLLQTAAELKASGDTTWQFQIAGDGPTRISLESFAQKMQLLGNENEPGIQFLGYISKEEITKLFTHADVAIVPNKTESWVACPYKAAEYSAAGLPMISCLKGEFAKMLATFNAGFTYEEGNKDSLLKLLVDFKSMNDAKLNNLSENARKMAESLFDRTQTYTKLVNFIIQ